MTDRLAHVCLNVPDADAAVEWYTDNFDVEAVDWSWSWEGEQGHTENRYVVDDDGFMLQFKAAEEQDSFEPGEAWDHLGIVVDDVEAAVERVDHHGIVIEPQYNPNSGADIAFVKDPWGYVIELLHPDDD